MYCGIQDVLPAGVVDHVVEAKLIDKHTTFIMIVKGCIVHVYRLDARLGRPIFETQCHFTSPILQVVPISATSASNEESEEGRQNVIFAFQNAKFTICSYEPVIKDFVNQSLYCFSTEEGEGGLLLAQPQFRVKNLVSVSEGSSDGGNFGSSGNGSIAIFHISNTSMAVLIDGTVHVISLENISEGISNVIDFRFLPGFMEPTIVILFEPSSTWPYLLPRRRDTLVAAIFSIDCSTRRPPKFTIITSYNEICSDCQSIFVPSCEFQPRGFFLAGANHLIYINPGYPSLTILGLNSYAARTTAPGNVNKMNRSMAINNGITLGQVKWNQNGSQIFLVDDEKRILECRLEGEGANRRIDLSVATKSLFSPSINALKINEIHCFNDWNLIVTQNGDCFFQQQPQETQTSSAAPFTVTDLDLEDDIYGPSSSSQPSHAQINESSSALTTFCIPGHGHVTDLCVGGAVGKKSLELVTCSSYPENGTFNFFKPYLPLKQHFQCKLPNVRQVFPLVIQNNQTIYLGSTDASTIIYEFDCGELRFLGKTAAFIDDEPTLAASILSTINESVVAQVTPRRIRLLTKDFQMVIDEIEIFHSAKRIKCWSNNISISNEEGKLITYQAGSRELTRVDTLCVDNVTCWAVSPFNYCHNATATSNYILAFVDKEGTLIIKNEEGEVIFENSMISSFPISMNSQSEEDLLLSSEGSPSTKVGLIREIALLWEKSIDCLLVALTSEESGLTVYTTNSECKLLVKSRPLIDNALCSKLTVKAAKVSLSNICFQSGMEGILLQSRHNSSLMFFGNMGKIRIHPLRLFQSNTSNNSNIFIIPSPFSLLYSSGEVYKLAIDENYIIDYSMPFQRLYLENESIRSVVYHSPSNTYAVLSITSKPFTLPSDDYAPISDNPVNIEDLTESNPKPLQFSYKIKLFSSESAKFIDEYCLEEDEYALCLSCPILDTKQTNTGRQPFIAVGTASNKGEDRPARGRVLVFDVIQVVISEDIMEGEEEGSTGICGQKLKLLCNSEMKGPVTALSHLSGCLIVGLASKVILHSFENNESLTGVAFVDVGVYTSNISAFKCFFTVGDISKSLYFCAFQEKPPKIVPLGRDFTDRTILSNEFIADSERGTCLMLAGDLLGNIHFMEYAPNNASSEGGLRLVHRGSIRWSEEARRMKRVVCGTRSQGCLIGGGNGSISLIYPISEELFRRAYGLQLRLAASIPHAGGMHPRAARQTAEVLDRPLPLFSTIIELNQGGLMRWNELPIPARDHLRQLQNIPTRAALTDLYVKLLDPIYQFLHQ